MERLPTNVEKVEQEKREISPEKRSRMWKRLRIAALSGMLAFGGYQAGKQATEHMFNPTEQEQEDIIKEVGEQNRQENERLQQAYLERQALIIKDVEGMGSRIEEGKLVSGARITTMDGKQYETRTETDFTGERQNVTESTGAIDWNRAFVSSIHKDGSGLKIVYEATKDGLEMTTQELGPGGQILSQRTSLIQEKSGS